MKANEALVLDMFRAVEERDVDRILEINHPDVEFVGHHRCRATAAHTGDPRCST